MVARIATLFAAVALVSLLLASSVEGGKRRAATDAEPSSASAKRSSKAKVEEDFADNTRSTSPTNKVFIDFPSFPENAANGLNVLKEMEILFARLWMADNNEKYFWMDKVGQVKDEDPFPNVSKVHDVFISIWHLLCMRRDDNYGTHKVFVELRTDGSSFNTESKTLFCAELTSDKHNIGIVMDDEGNTSHMLVTVPHDAIKQCPKKLVELANDPPITQREGEGSGATS